MLQWCVHAQARAFHARASGEVGQAFKGLHELGAAIRIAGVVDRVDAAEQVGGADHLRPSQRQRQHDGVARRDVGDRDIVGHGRQAFGIGVGVQRHVDGVAGERRAADAAQVDRDSLVGDRAQGAGDARGGVELGGVALTVAHAQGVHVEALLAGQCDHDGGVHAPGDEDDGVVHSAVPVGSIIRRLATAGRVSVRNRMVERRDAREDIRARRAISVRARRPRGSCATAAGNARAVGRRRSSRPDRWA